MPLNNILKLSRPAKIFFIILDIVAIYYTLQNRNLTEFISYSLLIIGIILVVALVFFGSLILKLKTIKPFLDSKNLLTVVFCIIALGPIYYSLFVSLKSLILFLISLNPSKILIAIFVFCSGLLLFFFHLYFRIIYGFTEVLFGIYIGFEQLSNGNLEQLLNSNFFIAFLTASIYLIVRGFDNIHQGINKENKEPFIKHSDSLVEKAD